MKLIRKEVILARFAPFYKEELADIDHDPPNLCYSHTDAGVVGKVISEMLNGKYAVEPALPHQIIVHGMYLLPHGDPTRWIELSRIIVESENEKDFTCGPFELYKDIREGRKAGNYIQTELTERQWLRFWNAYLFEYEYGLKEREEEERQYDSWYEEEETKSEPQSEQNRKQTRKKPKP